jgi:hypothetical protein
LNGGRKAVGSVRLAVWERRSGVFLAALSHFIRSVAGSQVHSGMLRAIQYSGNLAEWAIARIQITSA